MRARKTGREAARTQPHTRVGRHFFFKFCCVEQSKIDRRMTANVAYWLHWHVFSRKQNNHWKLVILQRFLLSFAPLQSPVSEDVPQQPFQVSSAITPIHKPLRRTCRRDFMRYFIESKTSIVPFSFIRSARARRPPSRIVQCDRPLLRCLTIAACL